MDGACSTPGRKEKYSHNCDGNSGGREAFGRPKPKWEDNIKMEAKEIKKKV